MASFLLFAAVVAVCGLMLWASYKMEPHWVSKDGERMICYGQCLSRGGQPVGRWRELRISKVRNDTLEVRPRRGSLASDHGGRGAVGFAGGMMKRRGPKSSYWKVAGTAQTPLRNRVVYVLDGNNDPNMPDVIAIRLPTKSKAIPMLEAMASAATRPSGRSPRSDRSAAQPDPS